MRISRERLQSVALATGYRPEVLEKVIHLLKLLERIAKHPFLGSRLVLKGGTALNLFLFDLPRLSVDLDLNYIGGPDRDVMLAERPELENALRAVCAREDYRVERVPVEHAGGKWLLRYHSALGQQGNLEIDVNFMFRVPLWPTTSRDSRQVGSYYARGIPVADMHELAAGKLAALLARRQARDLFDTHLLLTRGELDRSLLRLGFVVHGAISRTDWRAVTGDDISFDPVELRNHLLPLLRNDFVTDMDDPIAWAEGLVAECRQALDVVLPLSGAEREFLDRLLDCGEIDPSLLTADAELAKRILRQPMLEWKAQNVRAYRQRSVEEAQKPGD